MSAAVAVRERPILFSGEMIRALLDGRKTQTRRVVKRQPPPQFPCGWVERDAAFWSVGVGRFPMWENYVRCPYGQPGDRLWVRESWQHLDGCTGEQTVYRATDAGPNGESAAGLGWRPSIHMPRWASRLTLEITDVRVERVQDISHDDALAEGVMALPDTVHQDVARACAAAGRSECGAVDYFARLWDWINLPRGYGWDANPFVWVLSFRRVV